jgi:acyl-CoA reductase-like NAD-dependent aldehyde dehydrogenase
MYSTLPHFFLAGNYSAPPTWAVTQQVKAAVKQGAKILTGGEPITDCSGNYYPPTILTDIAVDSATA